MSDSQARLRLAATAAVVGAALGAAAAAAVLGARCAALQPPAPRPPGLSLDDEVVGEQLTRNTQFFGRTGQEAVCGAFVVVVGLGGVGSHAAHMLLRSGVGRLRLVDFDQVTLSSLNRHAVATRADVGLPKAIVLASHFALVCPEARVQACVSMFDGETEAALLGDWDGVRPDVVLDAIDNVATKTLLLAACHRRGLAVLCCAGAGGKADPSRLTVAPLGESARDPLARAVRHTLRKALGRPAADAVPVLFSSEPPRCGLVALAEGVSAEGLRTVPGFRVRTLPVLGTTPAAFGCAAAAWALCRLAGAPLGCAPPCAPSPPEAALQLERLLARERLRFGSEAGVEVDPRDVEFVMAQLWRCRSARHGWDGHQEGTSRRAVFRATAGLVLTRWEPARPAGVHNLVLLTFDEADDHDAHGPQHARAKHPDWARHVEHTLARAAREHGEL